ncbi:unnamed protein product [Auanema sp. JU1783]|nr:unnamed protein product [Auanema sp. JU1783]
MPLFSIDYADENMLCTRCKCILEKDALRLKRTVRKTPEEAGADTNKDRSLYFHPNCYFEMLHQCEASASIFKNETILEGFMELKQKEKYFIARLLSNLSKSFVIKEPQLKDDPEPPRSNSQKQRLSVEFTSEGESEMDQYVMYTESQLVNNDPNMPKEFLKSNMFCRFCVVCEMVAITGVTEQKIDSIHNFLHRDETIDVETFVRLLMPKHDRRVYNITEKGILKSFAKMYHFDYVELENVYKMCGDVSLTVRKAMEDHALGETYAVPWGVQKIDRFLDRLSEMTEFRDQSKHLSYAFMQMTTVEVMYLIRLIMKDLKINLRANDVLRAMHRKAYMFYKHSHSLDDLFEMYTSGELEKMRVTMSKVYISIPTIPMTTKSCSSMAKALSTFEAGLYAEIKYDGVRVQIHRKQGSCFHFFTKSMRPMSMDYLVLFANYVYDALPDDNDIVVDAVLCQVDQVTGKPLPLRNQGRLPKSDYDNACYCLFIFDLLLFGDVDLCRVPLSARLDMLKEKVQEIPNRVVLSRYHYVKDNRNGELQTLVWKAISQGYDSLILKDPLGYYEPDDHHWTKLNMKKFDTGRMVHAAPLIVLGAYKTGSTESSREFLLGVFDEETETYKTVAICKNEDPKDVGKLNEKLLETMESIDRNADELPKWLQCSPELAPDYVVLDTNSAPVWDVSGFQICKCSEHTSGVTIRFAKLNNYKNRRRRKYGMTTRDLKCFYRFTSQKSRKAFPATYDLEPLHSKKEVACRFVLSDAIAEQDYSDVSDITYEEIEDDEAPDDQDEVFSDEEVEDEDDDDEDEEEEDEDEEEEDEEEVEEEEEELEDKEETEETEEASHAAHQELDKVFMCDYSCQYEEDDGGSAGSCKDLEEDDEKIEQEVSQKKQTIEEKADSRKRKLVREKNQEKDQEEEEEQDEEQEEDEEDEEQEQRQEQEQREEQEREEEQEQEQREEEDQPDRGKLVLRIKRSRLDHR